MITFNGLISAREKGMQWQHALELSVERRTRGLQADVITYHAAISACENGRQWRRALGRFEECGRMDCRQMW